MRRLLAPAVLLVAAATGRADPPTADRVQAWIRDLDSPTFRTRDEAARKLRLAGAGRGPGPGQGGEDRQRRGRRPGPQAARRTWPTGPTRRPRPPPDANSAGWPTASPAPPHDARAPAQPQAQPTPGPARCSPASLTTRRTAGVTRIDLDNSNDVPDRRSAPQGVPGARVDVRLDQPVHRRRGQASGRTCRTCAT